MKPSKNRPKFKDIEVKPPVKQIAYEQPVFSELVKAPIHMTAEKETVLTFELKDSVIEDAITLTTTPVTQLLH